MSGLLIFALSKFQRNCECGPSRTTTTFFVWFSFLPLERMAEEKDRASLSTLISLCSRVVSNNGFNRVSEFEFQRQEGYEKPDVIKIKCLQLFDLILINLKSVGAPKVYTLSMKAERLDDQSSIAIYTLERMVESRLLYNAVPEARPCHHVATPLDLPGPLLQSSLAFVDFLPLSRCAAVCRTFVAESRQQLRGRPPHLRVAPQPPRQPPTWEIELPYGRPVTQAWPFRGHLPFQDPLLPVVNDGLPASDGFNEFLGPSFSGFRGLLRPPLHELMRFT